MRFSITSSPAAVVRRLAASSLSCIVVELFLLANFAIIHPVQSFSSHRLRAGCMILTNGDWGKHQSLMLNSEMTKVIHPEDKDSVLLSPMEDIVLACPGSRFTFADDQTTSAKCNRGTQLLVGKSEREFQTASCEKLPKTTAKVTGTCRGDSNIHQIEIGFEIGDKFITILWICFDVRKLVTVLSLYNASYRIAGRQHGFPRGEFLDAGFYNEIKIWQLYSRKRQRETIAKILGSKELADQYVKDDRSHYLARGHLTAKADFIFGAEQMGTFYYINVAPQWQIINAGNWAALEDSVRNYLVKNKLETSIFTVPLGVTSLPDVHGEYQELYLYEDDDGDRFVPVPKLYMKVVRNEDEKGGIAFLTVNNPYLTLEEIETQGYIICDDICDRFDWLTWDQHNIEKGYSYCCYYEDLKATFKTQDYEETLPDIPSEEDLSL